MNITTRKMARMEKYYGVMLVSFIGFFVSIIISINVFQWEHQQTQHYFEDAAHERYFRIQLSLKQYVNALEAIKGLYASSNNVDRFEFRSFVTPILDRYPEIQALEWVPKITYENRQSYILKAQKEGITNFNITETTPEDNIIPAGVREYYYPAYYLEPLSDNEKALGYDLGSNIERLTSLEMARDSGQAYASGRISLVQKDKRVSGFIIFVPIYLKNSATNSVEQRRANLQGFALGVFNIEDMFNAALKEHNLKDTIVIIQDLTNTNDEIPLYIKNIGSGKQPEENAIQHSAFQFSELMDIAGRQWKISFYSGVDFNNPAQYWQTSVVLIICLFMTAWLTRYIKNHQKQTENIQSQVDKKTRALKNTAFVLEQLHEITTNNQLAFNDKISQLLQLGMRYFNLSMGIVSKIENNTYTVLHVCGDANTLAPGTIFTLNDTYCAVTLKANSPIGFHNKEYKKRYILPFEDKFGINTYIGTSIIVDSKPFGTLNFTMPESRNTAFSKEDFSVVKIFAQWIGSEISREFANKEITHQKYLFESLFKDTPEPMLLVDLDRTISKVNPALVNEFGYQEQELLGQSTLILYENTETFIHQGKIVNDLNSGKIIKPFEINYKRKNNSVFPAETVVTALTDAEHNVFAFLGHIRNITARKESEKILTQQARKALLLHQVTSIAHETASFLEALQRCIDLVCDILEWPVAHVYIPDNQHNKLLPSSIWHLDDKQKHKKFVETINNTALLKGEGLFGKIWEKGTALWMENFSEQANQNYIEAEHNPFNGAVGFPIYVDHEIVAVLGFFFYNSIQPDYDLIRVLQILGEQVGRVFEKRRSEKSIADAEQNVRLILESAGEGLYGLDLQGKTTFVNPAAESMIGYSAEELIGKSMHSLIHHSYPDGTPYPLEECRMREPFTLGAVQHVDDEVLWRKDGTSFPVEYTSTPMWKEGKIVGAVITFRDITERLKIDMMKREFISTVSHELRTPLTSILGSLGLLAGGIMGEIPEKARQLLDIANMNSQRLLLLINDLLDMEKIASGKMTFNLKRTDLVKLVEQAIESNHNYARQYEVHYQLIVADEPFTANVDSNRFMQVMSNLLSNAAKFSPAGKPVEISITRHDNNIRVSVSDHGPGIPSQFHHKIFGKFSQADASDTRQKGGTGLGLHISREIVQKMRGSIGFDTTLGEGTTFYVDLPDHTPQTIVVEPQHYRSQNHQESGR